MGHVADTCQIASHDDSGSYDGGDSEVKMTRPVTGALRRPQRRIEIQSSVGSKEAACRLANRREATSWIRPGAGTSRDGRRGLARCNFRTEESPNQMENPETQAKASKTSARGRTRRSPMLAHEASPVSGASVEGMTYGACHVPSYLPAGIPGVSTARRQEDRLCLEGRMCQQPAGDSTEEGRSWATKTRAHQRQFRRKWAGPDKSDRGQGRDDACHDRPQPIRDRRPFPTIGSKAKWRAYASQMPDPGERYFIKRNCQSRAEGSRQGCRRRGAGSRPKCYLTCNQAPAYIRGPGPLV
jgi:hypothetical protein